MTADGLAEGAREPSRPATAPPVEAVLAACDGLMDEIGRRNHLFAWLRAPDAGPQQWLPVDAYYPGNRLVVVCREQPTPHDRVYAELVPAHGLRLLQFAPADLGPDPQAGLARLILELAEFHRPVPAEPPEPERRVRESVLAQAVALLSRPIVESASGPTSPSEGSRAAAAERASRFVAARTGRRRAGSPSQLALMRDLRPASARRRVPVRGRAPTEAPPTLQAPGLLVGLAAIAVLCAEVYFGVARVALNAGHLFLGFGIAIDVCARALGAIAAARAGRTDWVWLCVLCGSPAVAIFALFQRSGPVITEPAPLAGLLSLLAVGVVGLAIVAGALGI